MICHRSLHRDQPKLTDGAFLSCRRPRAFRSAQRGAGGGPSWACASIRPLRSHVSTLWRRWLRRTAVVPSEDSCSNLHRDLIQPLLGPIRPVLVMPNLCLKLSHPAFSGSNLPGKFVSHFYGLLAICLSSTSAGSAGPKLLGLLCRAYRQFRTYCSISAQEERRHLLRLYCDCSWHSNTRSPTKDVNFITQTALRQFAPLWITLFRHGCGFQAK